MRIKLYFVLLDMSDRVKDFDLIAKYKILSKGNHTDSTTNGSASSPASPAHPLGALGGVEVAERRHHHVGLRFAGLRIDYFVLCKGDDGRWRWVGWVVDWVGG